MAAIRYESLLVEQALCREYAAETERVLKSLKGLNEIKTLVREFEHTFAQYIGVAHAVAVNSGSDALKMCLLAAGVKPKDEVLVPNLTYQAVALAVIYAGAKPVPVEAKADDLQMDPEALERSVTKKTKAVIAAHMFGRACAIETIKGICRKRKIVLIEDVCQAESSTYQGRKLGAFGDLAAFSFSYYKPLSSCGGGGGMVICPKQQEERIRRWMEDWRSDAELLNMGQRFAPMGFLDLIALRVKFSRLKEIIKSRHLIKSYYEEHLTGTQGLTIFKDPAHTQSVAQNFVVCAQDRDGLMRFLENQGIMVQRPYVPLHRLAIFRGKSQKKFPVSDWYAESALHLPLHSFMGLDKARTVADACRQFRTEIKA